MPRALTVKGVYVVSYSCYGQINGTVCICIIEASELILIHNSHTIMYTVYSTYWGTVFNYISTMFSTVLSNVAQPDAFICNALSP